MAGRPACNPPTYLPEKPTTKNFEGIRDAPKETQNAVRSLLLLTRFGTYEILNATSNLCLTGSGDFTNVRQQLCGPPGSGQQWTLIGAPSDFQVADSESGNTLCMDVEEGSDGGDHTPVILEKCSVDNPRQHWHF